MLLSDVSVLVVAQSSSEIPEGLMNNPVFYDQLLVPEDSAIYEIMSKFIEESDRQQMTIYEFGAENK